MPMVRRVPKRGFHNRFALRVTVVNLADLERFGHEWKLHHPIEERQLEFASRLAIVASASFYHGSDELYELEGIPGMWHEACLRWPGEAVQQRVAADRPAAQPRLPAAERERWAD